jgi:hypothetical protein
MMGVRDLVCVGIADVDAAKTIAVLSVDTTHEQGVRDLFDRNSEPWRFLSAFAVLIGATLRDA